MGVALEVITGRVLNPGATISTTTPNTGDTYAVRAFDDRSNPAWLEGFWAQQATAGVIRVRSAKLHDNVQGIRYRSPAAVTRNLIADHLVQRLYSTDTLIPEQSGGGAETDVLALMIYYSDLPGAAANLATWEAIRPQVVELVTVEVAVAGPVTAGDWSAGNALNSFTDLLKADTKYALIGYQTDVECCAVGIKGPDTSNYRVGGPGCIEPIETRDWFVSLAMAHGTPHIPILNANNKGATLVSVAKATAAGTVNVDLTLAELAS